MLERDSLYRLCVAALFRAAALSVLLTALVAPVCNAASVGTLDAGESIYQRGALGSGKPLEASRPNMRIAGVDAACINCHQRSGLGSQEGRRTIPPITGRYLFRPLAKNFEDSDLPYVEGMRADRSPYTDATLARAIRDGLDSEGKPLDYLMPRFAMNDADMAALIVYLKRLDPRKVPGVTDTVLHFATIITPDADPIKARGMLDVIEHYFTDKNAAQRGPKARLRPSGKTMFSKMMFLVNRHWQLHVWQLTGPASSWQKQLERYFAEEPVLAVVSGLAGSTWAPVHAFCEQNGVPCLFPNVEVPPSGADLDFYSMYFSKGVLLEAGLIANDILKSGNGKAARVVKQIYRAGDNGESAAKALAAALEQHGIKVQNSAIAHGESSTGVDKTLRKFSTADALVLWLRPEDLAALGSTPASDTVFMSGLMGGLEKAPLPASWRSRTRIAYPFDLPEKRRVRVDYALGWFRIRHIPVVAEQVQADTYLACGLLAETLGNMVDAFIPDYLVERVQDTLEHRALTGYYPRLTLGPGQRFASKGGYIVHFSETQGTRLIADNNWLAP